MIGERRPTHISPVPFPDGTSDDAADTLSSQVRSILRQAVGGDRQQIARGQLESGRRSFLTKLVGGHRLSNLWSRRGRASRRLRNYGLASHLVGLWIRRHFQQAGVLVVRGGWPLPQIDNRGGRIEAGSCGFFSGVRLECWPGATISIGNGTYLNRNAEIVAAERVTIGEDCKIARDVIIMDTDQHELPESRLVAKPVQIGDRVWIGSRAIILKGVEIGDDCIIGAGAVVTKSMPARTVIVGPAARAIRELPSPESPDLSLARPQVLARLLPRRSPQVLDSQ